MKVSVNPVAGQSAPASGPLGVSLWWHHVTQSDETKEEGMGSIIRVRLVGDNARLGRVAATDVGHLLIHFQSAMARAGGHVLGRQVPSTGRRERVVEQGTRFRLVSVDPGSVVSVLELPEAASSPDVLDLDDDVLGEVAASTVLDTIEGTDESKGDVARALVSLSDKVGVGTRFDAMEVSYQRTGGLERSARFDRSTRDRLDALTAAGRSDHAEDVVAGVLMEADFERFSARLRTQSGAQVSVAFEPDLADAIQDALRRPAAFRGEVSYDARTSTAKDVHLRAITRADQLAWLEPGDFLSGATLEELAAESGLGPVDDPSELRFADASDAELDAFLEALDV